jgi:hypothetical protein
MASDKSEGMLDRALAQGATQSQNRWVAKAVEQLCAMEGAEQEARAEGGVTLRIAYEGRTTELAVPNTGADYQLQKNLCARIGEALTALGITEGVEYTPPKSGGRAMTPELLAMRKKQRQQFDAWHDIWHSLRQADISLDIEREITQMQDYY